MSQILTTSSTSVTCTISGIVEYVNFEINTDNSSVSYSTSYIEAIGTIETRAADFVSKGNLENYINSQEGVLYLEMSALANNGINKQISLSDGSSLTNKIALIYTTTSNQIQAFVRASGSISFNVSVILSDITNYNKIALKYKQNDFSLWVNGVEVATGTSGNTPINLSELDFDNAGGGDNFQGKVKDLQVYTTALTDQELTDLTS